VDQLFGRLASFVKHHHNRAAGLGDFATGLSSFLGKIRRPHEPLSIVRRMDSIRDWKSHLLKIPRHLAGIGGPRAPKVYEFMKPSGSDLFYRPQTMDVIFS
jgi:hypothetical protein